MAVFSYLTAQLVLIGWNVFGLTTLAGATMFANVVLGAGLLALGIGANALSRPPQIKTAQAQAVINQSTGPRLRGYGRVLLGGTRAFFDSKSGDLYQVIMLHHGEVDAIEAIRIGDITATLNEDGDVTNPEFSSGLVTRNVRIRQHLGSPGQTADSMMTGAWSGVWTSAHRLRGIANLAVRFKSPNQNDFQKIFPESHNTPVRALSRLSRVYDPRQSGQSPTNEATWAWRDTAALAIRDYLTHQDGMRLDPVEDVDDASIAAFANVCDSAVGLKAGGTEKRYRLWGIYTLTDEPQAVLRRMLNTCDGEFYLTPEGKVGIRGGVWEAPTVTIGAEHILSHSFEQGNNRFAAFNELKVMYTSPEHDYQPQEATAWVDLADQAERGEMASEFDGDFIPSPSQARRCSKIFMHKANPRWKGRVVTDAYGLMAMGERMVRLVIPELEIDDAFLVGRIQFSPDLSSVEIEVSSISQAAYDWDPSTEEGENPPPAQDTSPDLTFPVPENLTLTNPESGVVLAEVDPIDRDGLELEVWIRAGAGANWLVMDLEGTTEARLSGLPDGSYQAQARWRGPQNTAGEWSFPLAEITIPVPPPEPE